MTCLLNKQPRAIRTYVPDSKVPVAHMGSTWVLTAPGGPHVGPMNLAIRGTPVTTADVINVPTNNAADRQQLCRERSSPLPEYLLQHWLAQFDISLGKITHISRPVAYWERVETSVHFKEKNFDFSFAVEMLVKYKRDSNNAYPW